METQVKSINGTIKVEHLLFNFKAEILKNLEALVKVANRLKLTPPTWEFSDVYEYEFSVVEGMSGSGEDTEIEVETYIEKCFDITLHVEESLKIDGQWIFACAIDHRNKLMIQVDESAIIPIRYSPSNDCCEHCGKKYPRVQSFVVLNQETGEFKQVGKGCLKQFLGINPASYITMFEAVSKFSPMIEGYGRKNRGGRLTNLAYDVNEMLRYVMHQVAKDGQFIKAEWKEIQVQSPGWRGGMTTKNVRANEGEATFDKVKVRMSAISYFRMHPHSLLDSASVEELQERIKFNTMRYDLFSDIQHERKIDIANRLCALRDHLHAVKYKVLIDEQILPYIEEIAAVKAWMFNMVIEVKTNQKEEILIDEFGNNTHTGRFIEYEYVDSFNEWKKLIKGVFAKDRTLQENLKSICSGFGFYVKQVEREAADAIRLANAANLKHIGTVGQKVELTLKVLDSKTGQGQFGEWILWKMEDANGNKFSKFGQLSEKHIVLAATDHTVDTFLGSTIKVLAEVKKHDEFRGEKITALGRMSKVNKSLYLYK